MFKLCLLALIPIVGSTTLLTREFIEAELNEHYLSPEIYYLKPAHKKNESTGNFIIFKDKQKFRNELIARNSKIRKSVQSEPDYNDNVEDLLVGQEIEKNIFIMEGMGLTGAMLTTQPWSDDYWAIYKGVLGARYADENYEYMESWDQAYNYVKQSPAPLVFRSKDTDKIDLLSPSEKFDLLLFEDKETLTNHMWEQGRQYAERDEDRYIETWMGICHGWAAASYMVKRPIKSIEVMSHDNKTKIKFYPADVKALTSLLWASTKFETNFIGGRCNSKDPQTDVNGRVLAKDCLDNNPASLHLALVNGIGKMDKSFVMDATFDYQVWNQPIVSYEYKYFNPLTRKVTKDATEAYMNLTDYVADPYKKHRSSKTKYVIGIAMEVEYSVETSPIQMDNDSIDSDSTNSAYYFYDLELDGDFNIVGGEWYTEDHPDFLWTPDYQTQAMTSSDYYLTSRTKWNGKDALANDIKKLGVAAAKQGSPLAYIVNSLIELAQ